MISLETAAQVVEATVPVVERLADEAAELMRMPLTPVVTDGVQEEFQLNCSTSFRGITKITAAERMAQALRDEPPVPFSSLKNRTGFILDGPRQLSRAANPYESSTVLRYETIGGRGISVIVPSISEVQHAPTDELFDVIGENKRSLLSALSNLKPGEYPKLGWHGTSVFGKDFLFEQRRSFGRAQAAPAPLWIHTPLQMGTNPESYLNDTQHLIASSTGIRPLGDTTADNALVVLDRSVGDWLWNKNQMAWQQMLARETYPVLEAPTDRFFGAQSMFIGKTHVPIDPGNFDTNILGAFDNTPRPIDLDISRNYFDKWKYERVTMNSALHNQESVAQSWDLAGLLRRVQR